MERNLLEWRGLNWNGMGRARVFCVYRVLLVPLFCVLCDVSPFGFFLEQPASCEYTREWWWWWCCCSCCSFCHLYQNRNASAPARARCKETYDLCYRGAHVDMFCDETAPSKHSVTTLTRLPRAPADCLPRKSRSCLPGFSA